MSQKKTESLQSTKKVIYNNSNGDISTLRKYDIKTKEQWEIILLSSTPEPQLTAVWMAEAAARIQGIQADS